MKKKHIGILLTSAVILVISLATWGIIALTLYLRR